MGHLGSSSLRKETGNTDREPKSFKTNPSEERGFSFIHLISKKPRVTVLVSFHNKRMMVAELLLPASVELRWIGFLPSAESYLQIARSPL